MEVSDEKGAAIDWVAVLQDKGRRARTPLEVELYEVAIGIVRERNEARAEVDLHLTVTASSLKATYAANRALSMERAAHQVTAARLERLRRIAGQALDD